MGMRIDYRNAEHYADPTAHEALNNIQEDEIEMEFYRGDIFYIKRIADRSTGELLEQGKPAVIVSNDVGNEHSEYVSVCYIISNREKPLPTHVDIELNGFMAVVACESIHSVSKARIGDFIRECTGAETEKINRALLVSLALDGMTMEERPKNPPPCGKIRNKRRFDQIANGKGFVPRLVRKFAFPYGWR